MRILSVDGQRGIELVDWPLKGLGCCRGTLQPIGKLKKDISIYHFMADDQADTWVLLGEDIKPKVGASLVKKVDLGDQRYWTVVLLTNQAVVVRCWNPILNSRLLEEVELWVDGRHDPSVSPGKLLMMGLIESDGTLEPDQ